MSDTVNEYIDSRFFDYVAELQDWTRQPSVSTYGTGMFEMAEKVRLRLERAGGAARIFEIPNGYPIVYGGFKGTSKRTLLFYNHYDVQPPGSLSDWRYDPFGGEVADGRLYARGAADNKGCLLSRIHAVEAVLKTTGQLPIDVIFLVEGEEEIGSSHLGPFVNSHRDLLKADACIWEYAAKDGQDRPSATLGNKGICYVELTAKGSKADFHSMYASLIPNAAWRLVWALSTLKDEAENILIGGFYDDIKPFTQMEVEVLEKMVLDEEGLRKEAGYAKLLQGTEGIEAKRRLYGAPSCTICGLVSGHIDEGVRTILPAVAKAKVDFRLVLDQKPEDILSKLCAHLDHQGFDDIVVTPLMTALPSKTPVTDPFVDIIIDAAAQVYDQPLQIQLTSPGTGPRSVFTDWTYIPIIGLGVGHIASQVHAPNENIALEDYRQGTKHIAAIIELFGAHK